MDSIESHVSGGVRLPGQVTFTVEGRSLPRMTQLLSSLCRDKGCSYEVRDPSLEDVVLWQYAAKGEDG